MTRCARQERSRGQCVQGSQARDRQVGDPPRARGVVPCSPPGVCVTAQPVRQSARRWLRRSAALVHLSLASQTRALRAREDTGCSDLLPDPAKV